MKPKLLPIFLLSLFLTGCSLFHGYTHLSDAEMADNFQNRTDSFNELLMMFIDDSRDKTKHYWIGKDWNYGLDEFSNERREKYLSLMDNLGIRSIGRKLEDPRIIEMLVDSDGKDLSGMEVEIDTKGYAYLLNEAPPRLVAIGETQFWGNHYKKIDENWYIFHSQRSGHPN